MELGVRAGAVEDVASISEICKCSAVSYVTLSDDTAQYFSYLVDTLGPDAILEEVRNKKNRFLVAEEDGIMVGVLAGKRRSVGVGSDTSCHIRHFYVARPGQGIGRRLWEEMRWRLLADEVDYVTVNSTAFAQQVYEKLGFQAFGEAHEHEGILFQSMELYLAFKGTPLPVLLGTRLQLRAYRADDAHTLCTLANSAELAKFLPAVFPHPFTFQDAENWVRFSMDKTIWAVTFQDDVIGNVRLINQDMVNWGLEEPSSFGGEIRFWLGEEYWGRGYGAEMLETVLLQLRNSTPSWAMSYHLVARVPRSNVRAIAVLEKVGFSRYRQVTRMHKPHKVCKSRALQDCVDLVLQIT